uniref:glutamate decarboxylase n=1 Tax=Oryza glumipatula TaxID=40148 RepID=A0A0D9ZLE6_9ORYZ
MVLTHVEAVEEGSEAAAAVFASRYVQDPVPRYELGERSISKDAAYQIVHDELLLDSSPRLNLASFVTTWMEPECDRLILEAINKNYADMDEYPVTTELQASNQTNQTIYPRLLHILSLHCVVVDNRCVNIIARLFNAPVGDGEKAVGVGTVGSSEAIMLAGLAFKRRWQNRRKAAGKPHDKPNIVTGANVQVCWEKFARYFEVELKEVKLTEGCYVMDPVKAVDMVDENTICVASILGSTLTGEFEDVRRLNDLLAAKNKRTGWDTPIHVDAASGGFIAPFIYPELEWDFRLPLVKSINVSGHKYGLVYAGVGWGYKSVMKNCMESARTLREGLEKTGRFTIISKEEGVPLVAFTFKDGAGAQAFRLSSGLRRYGWIVPAYTMPAALEHMTVLRVVVREDFGRPLAERFLSHVRMALDEMDLAARAPVPRVQLTIELGPARTAGEEASVRVVKSEAVPVRKSVPLVAGKTKGVC